MTVKNNKFSKGEVEIGSVSKIIKVEQIETAKWKSNIRKSYLIEFFMGLHFISGVLLPFFLIWGRLSFAEVMLLQSWFTTMIIFFEIPCGAIADYLSRKLSIFLGTLTTALAALIYASYPNIIVFMIGETFFAMGGSLISGTYQAFAYDTLRKLGREQDITKIIARSRIFMLLGVGISAPLGSIIGVTLSLQFVMSLMFLPFIVATIIAITLKEPNHDLVREKHEKYLRIVKSGVKELIINRILRKLALNQVVTETFVFFLVWTYQLYLGSLNLGMEYFGFVAASMTLVQIIVVNFIPRLMKHSNNKKVFLQLYSLIPGVAYVLISFISFIPMGIALILIVIGMGFSRRIIFIEGINKQIETENRATVLSAIGMIACLIRSALYPLIGYIVMVDLRIIFIVLGALIIILAIFTRIPKESL
ncbi:MAG: MFS transporter [Candidatus Hermodarchaeota archaeon]